MKRVLTLLLVLASIMVFYFAVFVAADATDPIGPNYINQTETSTLNATGWAAKTVEAEAGNVTALVITATSQTQTWQGYYGDITGTITLDSLNNWTMYDWAVAEPQGEIYASNQSTVNWSAIKCFNYSSNQTKNGSGGNDHYNLTDLEDMYGISNDDNDGVSETFNESGFLANPNGEAVQHKRFWVGTTYIANGTCPATDTYQNDSSSGSDFQEVLLSDRHAIVFTTILEDDTNGTTSDVQGFNNVSYDFQMLVGEDGHSGDTTTRQYYFFVELE